MILNRDLLKIKLKKNKIPDTKLEHHIYRIKQQYSLTEDEAKYFVFKGEITNQAYHRKKQNISILYKTGKTEDIVKASDQLNLKALSKPVTKYYICFPKEQ